MKALLIHIDERIEPLDRINIERIMKYLANSVDLQLSNSMERSHAVGEIEVMLDQGRSVYYNFAHLRWKSEHHFLPFLRLVMTRSVGCKSSVEFASCNPVPPIFKGRRLYCEDPAPAISDFPKGEVLAAADGKPAWITEVRDGVRCDTVFLPMPWITKEACLFEHLKGPFILRLVPVIEWLRFISDWHTWKKPPMRATIMFDDPNLHGKTYGFIRFSSLAQLTEKHNFSVSFATIPLDLSLIYSKKAILAVKKSEGRMSFLTHGITHSYCELNLNEQAKLISSIKWGLRRIRFFEGKTGLTINRVVAPPHGRFSLKAMQIFSAHEFEGACMSWGSIWSSNRYVPWTLGLGGDCGRLINGLGVIPRFRLSSDMKNQILLNAYLGQPIIPVGHHWDIREGPDILSETAAFCNSLGEVLWCDVGSMCRSNYLWKLDGEKLLLRPMSRVVDVLLPKGLEFESVQVDLSSAIWSDYSAPNYGLVVMDASGKRLTTIKDSGEKWIIHTSSQPYIKVEVKTSHAGGKPGTEKRPPSYLKHIMRRLATEAKDRLMPFVPSRVTKRWSG